MWKNKERKGKMKEGREREIERERERERREREILQCNQARSYSEPQRKWNLTGQEFPSLPPHLTSDFTQVSVHTCTCPST